jgi:exonuclease V
MRTGSAIHKKLEDETHITVPVQVQSSEDRFGLRLWNTISGLRCLRETGLARELEVWGVIEGQVVNGVIDEVSHLCPDIAFEQKMETAKAKKSGGKIPFPPSQPGIAQAFAQVTRADSRSDGWIGDPVPNRQIYIADVKTRSAPSVPTGASLRPVRIQLMLYRKLLELLSSNIVDAEMVFARYNVNSLEPFTGVFMEAIGGVGPMNEVADFPNLLSLWSLLVTEMQQTFSSSSLSPILRVEYRYAKTGDVIGNELAVYEESEIVQYIAEKMAWWKGKREAKGVEIEEAFKCRICDFAEECSWRKAKVEESIEKSRMRREAREKSAV